MPDRDAYIKSADWGWLDPVTNFSNYWVASPRVSSHFGDEGDEFFDKMERNTDIERQDFVQRMRDFKGAYSDMWGDDQEGGGMGGSLLKQMQPGQDDRWGKVKALYNAVPRLIKQKGDIQKPMGWYNRLRQNVNDRGQSLMQSIGPAASLMEKTDDGYRIPIDDKIKRIRQIQGALGNPEEAAQFLNQAGQIRDYYGKPGEQIISRLTDAAAEGGDKGDISGRISNLRGMLPQINKLNQRLRDLGVKGEDVGRMVQQRMQQGGQGMIGEDQLANLNQKLQQATELSDYFGEGIQDQMRRQITQALEGGEAGVDESSKALQQATGIMNNMRDMGIEAPQARSLMEQLNAGEGGEDAPTLSTENLDRWGDVVGAAAESDVDLGRIFETGEDGKPKYTRLFNLLPDVDESTDVLDAFDDRYRTGSGDIDKSRLKRDMQGFDQVYDELSLLSEHTDMLNEYAGKVGLDDPSKLTDQYMDKDGEIDFDGLEHEVNFWGRAFQFLEENPDQKEKFDRITDQGKKLKGVGILSSAKDKMVEWAPSLFTDSEGNLRKNTFSAALSIGDWGQYIYKQLFEEKNPIAWLGAAAVAVPVVSGLWNMFSSVFGGAGRMISNLFGGGQGQGQQMMYGPRRGRAAVQAVQQRPQQRPMRPLRTRQEFAGRPQHLSAQQWMQQY